jgi:hypothetical protein
MFIGNSFFLQQSCLLLPFSFLNSSGDEEQELFLEQKVGFLESVEGFLTRELGSLDPPFRAHRIVAHPIPL